ncbi:MAG: hypothetical protein ACM4D3_15520 [Candidatus Sericytochromatia bacterium]
MTSRTRGLTWTRHDTDKIGGAVDGWQTATGTITAGVSLYDTEDKELTAADARKLTAALLDAADQRDKLGG